ncbi:hypothetical protein [Aquiflexum gelatinilyticum]|uniref:Protein BatD n=1 Tax=Aquiflexum gelatinilyticum TaxID=2961943 RepID=A0A9X2T2Y4_9BACT|nr:hypothetical protein [Aquiflexum gelatinilyticum]
MGKILFFLCIFSCFLVPLQAQSQDIEVEGYFMQDSAMLGERVAYVLKAKSKPGINIVFPDSTHNFSPFVLLEKKSFISSTQEDVTVDSVVYYVSNFSLDPVATLSLPVYEVFRFDSLVHKPLEAGLVLKLTINPLPEELGFKDNNVYQPIPTEFNTFVLLIILGVIVVLATIVLVIFGKKIKKQWNNWREKQKYKRFVKRWNAAETAFAATPDMAQADEILGLWKTYMEHLNDKPFREWTTTEISEFLDNKEIIKDFRAIEMVIYAGKEGKDITETCNNLKEICTDSFKKKITEQDESK